MSVCQLRRVVLTLGLTLLALVTDQVVLCKWLVDALAALAELGNLLQAGVSKSVVPQLVFSERAQLVQDGTCKVHSMILAEL